MQNYFLAGSSDSLLFGAHGDYGRLILLPLDRTRLVVAPCFLFYVRISQSAAGCNTIFDGQVFKWYQ